MHEVEVEKHEELLVLNLEALPFKAVRLFTVTASKNLQQRGNHYADSNEFLILVKGRITLEVTSDNGKKETIQLDQMGAGYMLHPSQFIRYTLHEIGDTILVLSDMPYRGRN